MEPLLADSEGAAPALSPGRWWVLAMYTLLAANQGMTWVLPGALGPNFTQVFQVTGDTLQLFLNYGCFLFLLVAIPCSWALDKFGVRLPVLACIVLMFLCSLLRTLATDASLRSLILVHLSCILNALVGPIAMSCPSKLAEDFFPPHERTTATAIATLGNQSGSVVVYLLIPLMASGGDLASLSRINYFMLAISAVNLIGAFLYFPALPPRPPSPSSQHLHALTEGGKAISYASLLHSCRAFLSSPAYLGIVISYSLVAGLSNAAGALLPQNLTSLGATQAQAGWLGSAANLGSIIIGLGAAALSDAHKQRTAGRATKRLLVLVTGLAGACFLAFAWCASFPQPWELWPAAVAYALGLSLVGAQICLSFDVAAEQTFGLGPEGTMLMGITLPMNAVTMIALFVPAQYFFSWINFAVGLSGLAGAVGLYLCVPWHSPRLDFDLSKGGEGAEEAQAQALLQ